MIKINGYIIYLFIWYPIAFYILQCVVIRWIREQKYRFLLVAMLWRNQHWFAELSRLLTAAPWPIPLRRDLLSQANGFGTPSLNYGATSLASRWEHSDLPEIVLNTISQARAPSTWCLYALKWSVFSAWCTTRGADPVVCNILLILSFLQELLEKGRSPSSLNVYVDLAQDSYSSLTHSYRWPISGQEQPGC